MVGDRYQSASGFRIYYQVVMEHPRTQQVTMACYDDIGTIAEHITLYDSTVAKLQKIIDFPWEIPSMVPYFGNTFGVGGGAQMTSISWDDSDVPTTTEALSMPDNSCDSGHQWLPYVGLTESYSYCKVCDEKRE